MADAIVDGAQPIGAFERDGYRVELWPSTERVRVRFNGEIIADTRRPIVLKESAMQPVWHLPRADVRMDRLTSTLHRTYCPYKGQASYWSINVGGRQADNAVWAYLAPMEGLEALADMVAFYPDKVDAIIIGEDEAATDGAAPAPPWPSADPMAGFLAGEALRAGSPEDLVGRLGAFLQGCDEHLTRLFVANATLHPLIVGTSYVWTADGEVKASDAAHASLKSDAFLNSPVRPFLEGGGADPVRHRLWRGEGLDRHGMLKDMRAEGATDYAAVPLPFSDGQLNAISLATARPGGFDAAFIGRFQAAAPLLGRLFEVFAMRRMARTLVETYVGARAGERVLYGRIKRGDAEDIRAVIWFCDLRSFTQYAEDLPRGDLVGLLNAYFSMMTDAVRRHGGDVLKFMGDAMLAIFPFGEGDMGDDDDMGEACANALAAAVDVRTAIGAFNLARELEKRPPIAYGIALHVGDVLYGNIGAPDRLDFTVIGPEVNLVSRIEAMTAQLDQPILMSEEFARAVGDAGRMVGEFELKGISRPRALYAPI